MKRLYAGVIAALFSAACFATTFTPLSLLSTTSSTSGQAIVSTGPTTSAAWTSIVDSVIAGSGIAVSGATGNVTVSIPTNGVALGQLAQQSANTVLANATGSTANVTAFSMPSCSTSVSALNWTTSAGFTCNTGLITAATVSSTYLTTATAASTYAPLNNAPLTGLPTAPTATAGTNTTQLATLAFANTAATNAASAVTPTVMTSYTPTVAAGSGTFTTTSATGRYYTIGKLVYFEATVTITTVGTASGTVIVGMPATTNASAGVTSFAGHETAVNGKMLTAISSASTSVMAITNYDATTAIAAGVVLVVSGSYVSN